MRSNTCIAVAVAELEAHGIREIVIARGAKHPQLHFHINGGPLRTFAVPGTPSDWRSPQNVRRDLRKLLREAGVIPVPERRERTAVPAKHARAAPMSGPACWHQLADEIEHRGAADVARHVEHVANTVETRIAELIGMPLSVPVLADVQLGDNQTSSIIRLSNELRDASASMRRAVSVARALAAMPPKL